MKVMNPGLPYLVRKALHKQILDKGKKITVCPHCRELNGTVKKCGLLKIVHEKYRSKKAADPVVTDALGELHFSCRSLPACENMVFFLNTSPILCHLLVHAAMKMKAVSSSQALLHIYHITWYYIPEACVLDAASYFAT